MSEDVLVLSDMLELLSKLEWNQLAVVLGEMLLHGFFSLKLTPRRTYSICRPKRSCSVNCSYKGYLGSLERTVHLIRQHGGVRKVFDREGRSRDRSPTRPLVATDEPNIISLYLATFQGSFMNGLIEASLASAYR
ncbi:hypothetical protein KIL84_007301 [Mauremys mutica]|uniref:Uncharacterized protein n=1 Tax=Mauremys mutica TaxID=74926 RepID=A0A9D3X2F5_9SAUR|nr:hypothetical protein KIL84_007301 [Mauremys mutica]